MNRILILLAMLVVGNVYASSCDWDKALNHYQQLKNNALDASTLTEEEVNCIYEVYRLLNTSRNRTFNYDGEEISLRDVERKCEVYRYSENYGEFECRGLRFLERKCEAYFPDRYERSGEIECRGSDLRAIERHCSVEMYSDSYGEISC